MGDQSASAFTLSRRRSSKMNGKIAVRLKMHALVAVDVQSASAGITPVEAPLSGLSHVDPSRLDPTQLTDPVKVSDMDLRSSSRYPRSYVFWRRPERPATWSVCTNWSRSTFS